MADIASAWHERQPRRLYRELEEMKARHPRMQLVRVADVVVGWQGSVDVNGASHFVHIRYPWDYPVRPPWLWETEAFKSDLVSYTVTGHQMLEGDLCLYTHGHDERAWKMEYTAACMIDRYAEFRSGVDRGAFVRPPRARIFRWDVQVWIPPALAQLMTVPGACGSVAMRRTRNGRMAVIERIEVHGKDLGLTHDLRMWRGADLGPTVHEGIWFRLDDVARTRLAENERPLDWSAVYDHVSASFPVPAIQVLVERASFALLSHDLAGAAQSVLAIPRCVAGSPYSLACQARTDTLENAIFARVEPVLGDGRPLRGTRVAMVGLGSLGSHVALELARAGVGRFLLYDPERLDAENICRHLGDLGDLGNPKVEILARAIERRNPDAQVASHAASPIGDGLFEGNAPFVDFLAALGSRDTLIVVTTADAEVERAINMLAVHAGTPVVYASVLGDAEHGRVFRVFPGKSACYQCVVTNQERDPGGHRWFPGPTGSDVPGIGAYRQPGIPGIAIDIGQIALLTARLALQTLGHVVAGGIEYPDTDADHVLWTNRGGWGFDRPLQIQNEHHARLLDCPICGENAEHRPLDPGVHDQLARLLADMTRPERMAPDALLVNE